MQDLTQVATFKVQVSSFKLKNYKRNSDIFFDVRKGGGFLLLRPKIVILSPMCARLPGVSRLPAASDASTILYTGRLLFLAYNLIWISSILAPFDSIFSANFHLFPLANCRGNRGGLLIEIRTGFKDRSSQKSLKRYRYQWKVLGFFPHVQFPQEV